MMRDSLVSINITNNNKLLNPSFTPILYYWNGEDNLVDSFIHNQTFINYVYQTCLNIDNYSNSTINYFFFQYDDNNNEQYSDQSIYIQDILKLSNIPQDISIFYQNYIHKYLNELYIKVFHTEYKLDKNFNEFIIDIFDQIKEKYPKRFSLETLLNYIRMKLQEDDIHTDNVNWILEQIKQILPHDI